MKCCSGVDRVADYHSFCFMEHAIADQKEKIDNTTAHPGVISLLAKPICMDDSDNLGIQSITVAEYHPLRVPLYGGGSREGEDCHHLIS